MTFDGVIVGGGPAGSAAGRLLASWGHAVVVLDKAGSAVRGLAESLPPSTRKLLAETGLLDAVDRAGFIRSTGNTTWWASRKPRIESFGSPAGADLKVCTTPGVVQAFRPALGYQVFRPDLDCVLLEGAQQAGADVRRNARVCDVRLETDGATIAYEQNGQRRTVEGRFVLDCSGRAGVIGRRFRRPEPRHRTYAIAGAWHRDAWNVPDPSHTLVETYDDGWAWSIPTDDRSRHVGVMVDGAWSRRHQRADLDRAYRAEIGKTIALRGILKGASLARVWACDASSYSSDVYADRRFFLVGDAGSFIDPLSSFGVKKALASAWLAAVAVHTSLGHPDRRAAAVELFSNRERDMYRSHLARSRDFAREASAIHSNPFWTRRAEGARLKTSRSMELDVNEPVESSLEQIAGDPAVQAALDVFRRVESLDLARSDRSRFERRPVIRGREIVLENAFAGGMRFIGNVDLVKLADIACRSRHVPDVFDEYCRTEAPVPLPNLLSGLSWLVAKGFLIRRDANAC